MGRSRYVVTETDQPHFLTCTVVGWLPLFSRPALVEIILESWRFQQTDREFQLWQEGSHAELICSEAVMREKLDYIHQNPVKRGYVDRAEHWRYSSARDYAGQPGLIGIDRWF